MGSRPADAQRKPSRDGEPGWEVYGKRDKPTLTRGLSVAGAGASRALPRARFLLLATTAPSSSSARTGLSPSLALAAHPRRHLRQRCASVDERRRARWLFRSPAWPGSWIGCSAGRPPSEEQRDGADPLWAVGPKTTPTETARVDEDPGAAPDWKLNPAAASPL